jgi:xanthine dehydrogenase accessory factor
MQLYAKAIELIDAGKPFTLASVIKASGSTPQKAGAKAIFEPTGAVWGTLGGGCLEAESRTRALEALDTRRSLVFDLSLDEDYGWDDGLICGGRVRILLDADAARHRTAFAAALAAADRRERGGLLTTLRNGAAVTVEWLNEGDLASWNGAPLGQRLRDALRTEKAACIAGDKDAALADPGTELYFEPIVPKPRLIIAGGGHVGQAVAKLAHFLEFEVTVIDDRPAFTNARLYPEGTKTLCGDIPATLAELPSGPDTYYVIVTRGHRHDGDALAACINKPSAYIGMIGSRRKVLLIRKRLIEDGIATAEQLDRVYSPMGLDIGSVTVPEIATSIAAELVAVRRGCPTAGTHLAEALRS